MFLEECLLSTLLIEYGFAAETLAVENRSSPGDAVYSPGLNFGSAMRSGSGSCAIDRLGLESRRA